MPKSSAAQKPPMIPYSIRFRKRLYNDMVLSFMQIRLSLGTAIICRRDKKRCEPMSYPFTKVVGKPPFRNKQLTPNWHEHCFILRNGLIHNYYRFFGFKLKLPTFLVNANNSQCFGLYYVITISLFHLSMIFYYLCEAKIEKIPTRNLFYKELLNFAA